MKAFHITIAFLLFHISASNAMRGPPPKVPWRDQAAFVFDRSVSDEFRGDSLDETKWDTHGLRNQDTGCPKWNGPPSSEAPEYATFFPTPTDPVTGEKIHQQYTVSKGKLILGVKEEPLEFFKAREYYCNATTFKCNHNENIDCFATNFFGEPTYKDPEKTQYRGIVHDKCKLEPFCIPHPEYVARKPRVYTKYTAAHLVSKKAIKYGYFETKVRLPNSPMLTAVWMHNDELVNGYCRHRETGDPAIKGKIFECPSAIRSRRWQEIDILEAMNTPIHKRWYVPNIHSFAMYKGEFSSATAVDKGDGMMGGGPIIIKKSVFSERIPDMSSIPESDRIGNDFHYSSGSVQDLDADWAAKSRTIGMYWSPNEIRFYLDGKEVRRIKNTIIHQPMFLDISGGWNVPWGQQAPRRNHLRRKAKIFYYRRWEVFTEGGVDPPSELPLDTKMERLFQPLYGDKMKGVHGLFPLSDNLTAVPTTPEKDDVMMAEPQAPNANLGTTVRGSQVDSFNSSDYLMWEDPVAVRMRRRKGLERAGGQGNRRFSRIRKKMNRREREITLSRPDRIVELKKQGDMPSPIVDGSITAFEFTDPNKVAAGWATKNGLGTEVDTA